MLVLSGTGIVCVLVVIAGFQHKGGPAAVWQIAGALYLVSVLILVGCHLVALLHGMDGLEPRPHAGRGRQAPPAASSPCEDAQHRSSGHGHAPTRRWSGT